MGTRDRGHRLFSYFFRDSKICFYCYRFKNWESKRFFILPKTYSSPPKKTVIDVDCVVLFFLKTSVIRGGWWGKRFLGHARLMNIGSEKWWNYALFRLFFLTLATDTSHTPVSQTHARSEICVGTGLPRSSSRGASWKANFAWGLRGEIGTFSRFPISWFSENRGDCSKMCGDWKDISNAWGLQRYIKMRGVCVGKTYTAVVFRGDGKKSKFCVGMAKTCVGCPTQGFVAWGRPHASFFWVGIAWGGFAWVSETGVDVR